MGLKVEPICRSACVARLNLLRAKSKPPIIARIWPVALSIASSAPSTTGSCSRSPVGKRGRLVDRRQPHLRRGRPRAESPASSCASTRSRPSAPRPSACPRAAAARRPAPPWARDSRPQHDGRNDVAGRHRALPPLRRPRLDVTAVDDRRCAPACGSRAACHSRRPASNAASAARCSDGSMRRVDRQAALVEPLGAVALFEVLPDLLEVERARTRRPTAGPP